MGLRELMRAQAEERQPPERVNSLEYLQRIYRDPNQPTPVRMRAAIEAVTSVTDKVGGGCWVRGIVRGVEIAPLHPLHVLQALFCDAVDPIRVSLQALTNSIDHL